MKLTVTPTFIGGEVIAPPSKSYLHRAIICASLANGKSIIEPVSDSDDIRATIEACIAFGARIKKQDDTLIIYGISQYGGIKHLKVNVNQSGSTLRFLIPLLSILSEEVTYEGKTSLFSRPLDVYQLIYASFGKVFDLQKNTLVTKGNFKSGNYQINASVSSQYTTGLLLALPLLEGDSTIELIGEVISDSYIEMTIAVLASFGVHVQRNSNIITIKGKQDYQPCNYMVEGDYSNAAIYFCLGALRSKMIIHNLRHDSLQGDQQIIRLIQKAGASIIGQENGYTVKPSTLSNISCSLKNAIDLGPIVMITALFCQKLSTFTDIKALTYKESNRLEAILEFYKLHQVQYELHHNTLRVVPGYVNTEQTLSIREDHRLVMAYTLFSLLSQTPLTMEDAESINKSYPNFFEDLKTLGVVIQS